MATYYARAVTGNWSANTSWDSTSSSGAGPAGPPVAGDTAVFDAGSTGTITLSAQAACLNLNMANHGGTLAFVGYNIVIGAGGSIVLGGTLTAATGGIQTAGNVTITSNSIKIPGWLRFPSSGTYTLNDDLSATNLVMTANAPIIAGAFNISCDNFYRIAMTSTGSLTLVAGQTFTVSTLMLLSGAGPGTTQTIKSSTESSDTFLHFNGTVDNCSVSNLLFTDVNCAHAIDNWYGGTLTRTTGITNVTSANLALAADASKIVSGQTVGGVSGSFDESARNTDPGEANVKSGTSYKILNVSKSGSYSAGGGLLTHPGMTGGMNG